MSELVNIEIQDHVAHVRFSRPGKMNALSLEMMQAIIDAAEQVKNNRDVRAVVLSGDGRAFCAGLDVSVFDSMGDEADLFGEGKGGFWPNYYQQPGYAWKQVPVPVIAALHGVTFGGGIQIALGADIRIAHPETQLSVMEIKWGLIPDMSGSQTLRDLVRLDVAKELVFTGRIFPATEALQMGLVTRLSEQPVQTALQMAQQIAGKNPDAIMSAKYLLEKSWHGKDVDGLRLEEKLQARIIGQPNQLEAVRAEMGKRKPEYQPRTLDNFEQLSDGKTVKG